MLTPQPAPDCEFKQAGVDAADPKVWALLKLDYERQCYKEAEAVARRRLRLLQSISSRCGLGVDHVS